MKSVFKYIFCAGLILCFFWLYRCKSCFNTLSQQKPHKPSAKLMVCTSYLKQDMTMLRSESYQYPYFTHPCMPLKGPCESQRRTEETGQPCPVTTVSRFIDINCPSLTISCSEASAPQRHSSGRCSSFSGGCSTHGPEWWWVEVRVKRQALLTRVLIQQL